MKSTFFKNISATLFCLLVVVHASEQSRGTPSEVFGIHLDSWDLTEGIHVNSTSNFVFETVNSLLQRWPNTRYRNGKSHLYQFRCSRLHTHTLGHTLVPATIPRGTLLYHGTYKADIPTVPEWLAMDPEHSYQFCGQIIFPPAPPESAMTNDNCWHLTMVTTRPLNLLYFDGSSAAKMEGPLDSQDLLAWGEIRPDKILEERERLDRLCEWANRYELDGFVR